MKQIRNIPKFLPIANILRLLRQTLVNARNMFDWIFDTESYTINETCFFFF